MYCAISGNVPERPVVSRKTGHVYEQQLVEKYIQETGQDPVTGETLTREDLLPLRTNKAVKPRPSPATSIPGLLGLFHDEWDALMLETHVMRQSLQAVRQELSHSLYQHDAACRVIARLVKERDEARLLLQDVQQTATARLQDAAYNGPTADGTAGEEPVAKKAKKTGITEDVINELMEVNAVLSKGRRKRAPPPELASVEDIANYTLLGSYPVHKSTQGGILAIDYNPERQNVVASGGVDSSIQFFDLDKKRVLGSLEAHSKKVTTLQYATPEVLISGSADATVRVWRAEGASVEGGEGRYGAVATLKDHTAEVVGVTCHPSKHYFVSASSDRTWCFYDLGTMSCLKQVSDEGVQAGYSCVQFHPDGLILGTGTEEKLVRIWEVKSQKNVAQFEGHNGIVKSLCFSENGYFLATAALDGVKLWDLRKLKNFKTLTPYDDFPCNTVQFDESGQYLAVGGADVRLYSLKPDWSVVKVFPEMPKRGVFSVRFGHHAKQLIAGASDHNLRHFGQHSSEEVTV